MNEDTSVLHYGQIEELAKQKYLDYAMSVITSRALPDVRDGLKPVQRRILYSMNLLGAGHKAAYKKSARIVGDVIGKYHPHGDSSVYEAMVRTAQPFSMRMLLIDGQGNFGSVDGDSAAAMRYTEARLHKFGEAMFGDIHLNTVDMQPNYDGSEQEPTVLPVAYPNLLINGVQGIAVGMASNIPPHNPIEIMEAVKYLIQCRQNQTQASLDELVSMVPSPDFPTGGLVHSSSSMREAWEFGRAKMKLRAKWKEEKVDNRTVIAVTELPYQVNKERLRKKIQDLASPITEKDHPNFGKPEIDGIYEVIDESDKSGIRLAIYLKHGHDANIVFNRLLQLTELETSISYNTTVIVKGEPKLIGLKDVLEHFIEHRNEIILRRTQTLYVKNLAREKILDGLMRAVDPQNLDKVISIVRSNRETAQAKEQIIEFLQVDEIQATAILELSLKRLTGLEIDAMREELEQKRLQNIQYREIIDSQQKRYEIMIEESNAQIEEFRSSKEDFGRYWTQLPYSKRLTDFTQETLETNLGSLIKEEESVILYSKGGYVRRSALEDFREQRRGTRGSRKFDLKDGDFIINTITAFSHDAIMFITESGRAFSLLAYEVPTGNSGTHINNLLLGKDKQDLVVKVLPIQFGADQELTIITQNGLVKRGTVDSLKTSQYSRGIGAINLSEGDRVFDAHITNTNSDLMFFKADNSVSRTPISKFSMKKGRLTSGVLGTKMTDKLVGVINADGSNEEGIVATISEQGLIKLTHIGEYRQTARNTKGVKAFKESGRSGKLINASYVPSLDSDIVTVTKNGIVNRISLEKVRVSSRTTTGVKLIEVSPGDEIASVFVVEKDSEE